MSNLLEVLFGVFACIVLIGGERARYDNYRLYRLKVDTDEQLKVLQRLESSSDGYVFWSVPVATNTTANVVVPPHKHDDIDDLFGKHNISNTLMERDFQKYENDYLFIYIYISVYDKWKSSMYESICLFYCSPGYWTSNKHQQMHAN